MLSKQRDPFVSLQEVTIIYLLISPTVVLTSEYPAGSFANIDRSLVPPNTLVVGRGWSLQNQTSLPAFVLEKFPLPIVSHAKPERGTEHN